MKCYLIDVDGTLVFDNDDVIPQDLIEKVNAIKDAGHFVVLFTCRHASGSWVNNFKRQGLKFDHVMEKPVAESYVYFDDRLEFADTKISD